MTATAKRPPGSRGEHRPPLQGEVISPATRIARWQFQPGQSGNPHGTSMSAYHEARRLCAKATPDAVRRLIELLGSSDERVAMMSADILIKRGAGPIRDHSAEDDAAKRVSLDALSPQDRLLLVKLLRQALGVSSSQSAKPVAEAEARLDSE